MGSKARQSDFHWRYSHWWRCARAQRRYGLNSHEGDDHLSTRRIFLQLTAAVSSGAVIRWQLDPTTGLLFNATRVFASARTSQTPLLGSSIPQFTESLPTFGGRRVSDSFIDVGILEFQQKALPDSLYATLPAPFNSGTYVWGYRV